jgi:hypothetical protein
MKRQNARRAGATRSSRCKCELTCLRGFNPKEAPFHSDCHLRRGHPYHFTPKTMLKRILERIEESAEELRTCIKCPRRFRRAKG